MRPAIPERVGPQNRSHFPALRLFHAPIRLMAYQQVAATMPFIDAHSVNGTAAPATVELGRFLPNYLHGFYPDAIHLHDNESQRAVIDNLSSFRNITQL